MWFGLVYSTVAAVSLWAVLGQGQLLVEVVVGLLCLEVIELAEWDGGWGCCGWRVH